MSSSPNLASLEPIPRPSVADQVFEKLHNQIIWLELPPETRLSEVEVARALDVSRQPVRDAFYRLSKLGFLVIRPQRATTVSQISLRYVREATFVRTALELEVFRVACDTLGEADYDRLQEIIDLQKVAVGKGARGNFHELDDAFHQALCDCTQHPFTWQMIRESKAHMDRVRLLSLSFGSHQAVEDHLNLFEALKSRDKDLAQELIRTHLGRIHDQLGRIRSEHPQYFADEDV
ncbi:GntR family transcriptional regulator [Tropicimonas isoalkanivorans]|uniref:Transcriptional regulator, GntR family n=1 Tax=Tropicimonas isoalkanivorans TaxID=441112 RepID=A0A1I1FT91_9RHOB|nr:GntR family transcriptional regulator [Tropicimonas isoalkanivorans]SFC02252.1 transcriptional regulator, GntR family [Tropicimonas isoalkanivorans]